MIDLENVSCKIGVPIDFIKKVDNGKMTEEELQERATYLYKCVQNDKEYYDESYEYNVDPCEVYTAKAEEKECKVFFDVIGEKIIKENNLFTLNDTREIYIYKNGVYVVDGVENFIKAETKRLYKESIIEQCNKMNKLPPDHIKTADIKFCNEVLEHIKVLTSIGRNEIDKNPMLINLKNGVLNFETLEFIDHNPKFLQTVQIPVTYNSEAQCPKIKAFLHDIVKEEDAKVLLEFIGYCLIPDTRFQQGIMLQGEGSNGKSIFLHLLSTFIGEKNISAIEMQALTNDKFISAELFGKLVNVFPDLPNNEIKDTGKFKALISGDMISAQKKFMQPFKFKNYARQIYSVNKVPYVRDQSFAFFRRIILIDFPWKFVTDPKIGIEKREDKDIKRKITTTEELSGLLNLAIEHAKELFEKGKYSYTVTVEEVAEQYLLKSDPIQLFIENYTEISDYDLDKNEMYDQYVLWSNRKKVHPESRIKFTKRLKKMGIQDDRPYDYNGNRLNVWKNIQVEGI